MEDERIVELYWNRDEGAIAATAEKYGAYCASVARNILPDPEDVQECVSDTYWKAWNSMPPHRPRVLATFLGKITRNLSLNRFRLNTAEKRGGGQVPAVLDELAQVVSDTDTLEQELDRRELIRAIDEFLAGLPEGKRRIFLSRYWYFDSISDIAARFGKTRNHISVILNRLRAQLRSHLEERGFTL